MADLSNRTRPAGIGIIGLGNISSIYLKNLASATQCKVISCADLDLGRAKAAAEQWGVPKWESVDSILQNPDVDVILNLTIPLAHFEVSHRALEAGKHAYSEKPLSANFEDGKRLVQLANEKGLKIGCAPDTFLGAAHQTCREMVDSGRLGQIVGAQAFMLCGGHESWHPSPEFYYKKGGGPMLDMGPYYLTSLVNLLGPITRAIGFARISHEERVIGSEPLKGTRFKVETPTHLTASYEFASGPLAQLTMSFDVPVNPFGHIWIFGSEGTLEVPDPNGFGGVPRLKLKGASDWEEIPVTRPHSENSRGLGLMQMVDSIQTGSDHRASGQLALHVLESMLAIEKSSVSGQTVNLETTTSRPSLMPN